MNLSSTSANLNGKHFRINSKIQPLKKRALFAASLDLTFYASENPEAYH